MQARQCRSLWVGGIGRIVTKEKLEEEFLKFGRIEEFKFFRDRNTALIDYFSLENAVQAQKSMNGRRIFGDQIRVDFVRSQPVRRVSQFYSYIDSSGLWEQLYHFYSTFSINGDSPMG